ncbi:MAG TPA: chorismate synthase [Spirochaetia bacterium]|nr:chorismate synthase [Spirochaetales bacterium]HPD80410.1 chorismate synthase [Spirochaetales bacterium]HQK34415.1 chorismate synthase [Spirochaetales bacterium]HRS65071.1 chorismate synthase [Spirochaetia bacterium]
MNSFGKFLRIMIFGESHGPVIGVTIDGVPPGIAFSPEHMQADLDRRRGGKPGTTHRSEPDKPRIISGIYQEKTTGAPLTIIIENTDQDSSHYKNISNHPRPSHSDFAARIKYNNCNDPRGGGHLSGRLTAPLVCAGSLAKLVIAPITVTACILDEAIVRQKALTGAAQGDSVGAMLEVVIKGVQPGLGEPWFDSLESLLAHAVFSIPGIKGIEFGAGFLAASMHGSEYNDRILDATGKTATNHDGGITGGISNGNDIVFRVAVKPTPSIGVPQETYSFDHNEPRLLSIEGRHDACFALRLPPVLEAVSALVLADLIIAQNAHQHV